MWSRSHGGFRPPYIRRAIQQPLSQLINPAQDCSPLPVYVKHLRGRTCRICSSFPPQIFLYLQSSILTKPYLPSLLIPALQAIAVFSFEYLTAFSKRFNKTFFSFFRRLRYECRLRILPADSSRVGSFSFQQVFPPWRRPAASSAISIFSFCSTITRFSY